MPPCQRPRPPCSLPSSTGGDKKALDSWLVIVRPPTPTAVTPWERSSFAGGVSIVVGSPGAAPPVAIDAVALPTCIKLAEGQEMIARFGKAYLADRRRVPFIMPSRRSTWNNHVGARHAQSRAFGASCPYSSRALAARFVRVLPASAHFSPESKGPSLG